MLYRKDILGLTLVTQPWPKLVFWKFGMSRLHSMYFKLSQISIHSVRLSLAHHIDRCSWSFSMENFQQIHSHQLFKGNWVFFLLKIINLIFFIAINDTDTDSDIFSLKINSYIYKYYWWKVPSKSLLLHFLAFHIGTKTWCCERDFDWVGILSITSINSF